MAIITEITAVTCNKHSRREGLKLWPHLAAGLVLHLGFHVDGSLIDAGKRVVPRVVPKRGGKGQIQSFQSVVS